MSQVKRSITIDAPPQEVFDTIMNPDRLGDWVTIHRSVKMKSPNPAAQGAEMDQVLSMRGVSVKVNWTLASVSSPHEARWEGRGPAGSKALIRYELDGPEEGPTTFAYTNEFSTPGGRVGMAASRVIVGSASEREAENSLKKLKALIEN